MEAVKSSSGLLAEIIWNKKGKDKMGRPKKFHDRYRYNLNLDNDLKDYLHEMAWRERKNITQYLNDLVRKAAEEFVAKGGTVQKKKHEITISEIEAILGYEIEIVENRKEA